MRALTFAIFAHLISCTPASCDRTPVASTTHASASALAPLPLGPFVAHRLDGPFPTLDAYCAAASKRDDWGPDRRCRSDDPNARRTASPTASARVFLIDDVLGGTQVASCGLAITTAAGTFVDAPRDPNVRCDGLVGTTSDVHTKVEELAWVGERLQLRVVETFGEWSPKTAAHTASTRERLVLCSFSANGAPRCTPPIDLACSDPQTPGGHVLAWSLDGNVLHLRASSASSTSKEDVESGCAQDGVALAGGDFVVW